MSDTVCAACGAWDLRLHLSVRGEMGAEGLIPTTDRFGTALGDIVRCRHCGHGQVQPMPDDEMLHEAYAAAESADYVAEEAGQRETARRWLAELEHHSPARGRLLDIGCWVGYLPAEAQRRGWRATGLEPSAFASRFARERLGVDVITAELHEVDLPAASFEAATMNDLIEHLVAPGVALQRVRDLLTPGGLIGIVLPDAGSLLARAMGRRWWSVIPTHVQYFTRRSIRTLLERHGYDVLQIATAPKAFTVDYYLGRVAGYSPAAGRALRASARVVGIDDRLWAPDFRDRMAVIARVG